MDIFADLIVEASDNLGKLTVHFQEQKSTPHLNGLVVKIHDLEDQGDFAFQKAISQLFEEERDPASIVKWKDILENLERIMDKYQGVSDIIEGIIVKSS